MNKQVEKDFIRLLKINTKVHTLLRQEWILWSLLFDELAGDCETAKAYIDGTIESDLYNFLDMQDINVNTAENITSKISVEFFKILERITNIENCSIKDYFSQKNKSAKN